jgi:hypothetical protein
MRPKTCRLKARHSFGMGDSESFFLEPHKRQNFTIAFAKMQDKSVVIII